MLIHGKTQEEHDCRLIAVLKRLDGAGATLNAEDCEFSKKEVKLAGYVLNKEGIKSDPEKTESIQDMDTPQNVSDVRRILGIMNQLGKFVFPPGRKHQTNQGSSGHEERIPLGANPARRL